MLRCLPCLTTVGMVGHTLSSTAHRASLGRIDGGAAQHEGTGGVVAYKAVCGYGTYVCVLRADGTRHADGAH
eukprot:3428553-Prymnesium_polylepis.1